MIKQFFIDCFTKLFWMFMWVTIIIYCHTEPLSTWSICIMSFLFVLFYDISRWASKKKDEYEKTNN